MPAISRIRLCNVIYENGSKRYNDQVFHFDGQNSALLLENGGGKTVFIQAVIQCIIPHINMADRKIKDTLSLEQGPAHIAIEWILNEQPRRYGVTVVSLYSEGGQLNSLKYTYEYSSNDDHGIEELPFKVEVSKNGYRPATRGEIGEYYQRMAKTNPYAKVFSTIQDYGKYLETAFKIIPSEWRKVAVINSGEGNVDEYFNRCKTTEQLLNNLLIPVVEEAIEGENSAEFAKTFEKQREHFKKNRILYDKIEQSKGVKEEIDDYVEVFKKYDQQLKSAKKVKGKAKTMTTFVEEQLESVEKGRGTIDIAKENLNRTESLYATQRLTYQIILINSKMNSKSKDIEVLEKKENHLKTKKDEASSRRQNIQMTKVLGSIVELENEVKRLNIELENAEKDLPTDDIRVLLNENSSNIKGYFGYELEILKLEKEKRQKEIDKLNDLIVGFKLDIDLIKTREINAKENVIKTQTTIDYHKSEMDRVYDELFDSQIGVLVDEYLSKWSYERKQIETTYTILKQTLKETTDNIDSYTKDKGQLEESLKRKNEEANGDNRWLGDIKKRSKELIAKINNEGIKISDKELIYTKEESIKALLQEKEEYYFDKKQSLLLEELELMTKDMLKNVMHPSIIKLANKVKESVDYLSLGQDYLYQLVDSSENSPKDLLTKYPFFAMTLVTNRVNKEKVIKLLDQHMNDLLVPVFVMTIEEISNIIKNNQEDIFLDNAIIPGIWNDSLTEGYLDNHNEQLEEALSEIKTERQRIDVNWATIKSIRLSIINFFENYSYESFMKISNVMVIRVKEEEDINAEIETIEIKVKELLEQCNEIQLELDNYINEMDTLFSKINLAIHHEDTYIKYLGLREDEEGYRSEVSDYIYERKDLEFKRDALLAENKSIEEMRKEFTFEERKILEHPLYKEVEGYEAICANVDIISLTNQRDSLKKKLAGFSISRESIEFRIQEQVKLLNHYESQHVRLLKEAEFEVALIDVTYDHEEDDLFDKIVSIKKEIKEFERELKKEEKAKWAFETEKNLLVNDLELRGATPYDFDCDLQYIPTKLKVFEGTIRDTKRKIEREEKEFSGNLLKFNNLLVQLKIKDGSHNFMIEEEAKLTRKEKEKLKTDLESLISVLFKELDESKQVMKGLQDEVLKAKNKVITYCRDEVSDFRLKEAITNGLIEKNDYNDLLIYQERMTDIINKTIQLANDDKRESDTELLTFLNHLLTYVKTVVHELGIVQKKTMIELESGNKQIFVFDIPNYEDEPAKEALRLYIDDMIELFEEEEERSDEHLRQLIEDRLSVKNLIPVVLAHIPIKIKCRKVTNDLKINKAPMSWEYSNKWSGGEKWSKNMTLFLGILNYLAEKKQHLSPNQKRNRTVILDNPFGKASSKHVLDPVFFIAEKLGFQIIALTAHAEGQFISDYFPIVYSLRLRDTNQENKLLMTTERVLNYTFLKENAPASINRLQEVEQLDLFKL